uniref:GmrSD restriction endonucleases N-terminal domain-containing protein n=1 Tax=Tetraselmis sp. GSL018 TaxID=582737 RepID=A0A061SK92_9CHLO
MAAADGSGPVSSSGSRDYRITQAPLGDIFGPPSIFIIPDYARAFSWPVAQVQTLLEDLKLSSQNGSEQFLGTLTFAHQATAGEPPEVVDGQQRMVVIFMVLSYLHSWAAGAGLNELRACLWRCLCHDQGTSLDGTQWVTYRLNFAHQAIAKFFKDNILNSFMPVVFVEAEMETFHGGSMGAIPMPNKLMWHLYQTASHVKRHLDTILHTPSGPANAERLVVHLLSRCFVVAVLCQGKERGPAIFAHLNSTGIPLSSNDCLKAKLLAKLPPEHHASFLAKWRARQTSASSSST